jgi:tetratricopeptide (TPR) repeat protein
LRINPTLVPAYVTRAEACLRIGLIEQAASDYEDVVRLDPSLVEKSPTLVQIQDILKRKSASTPTDPLALRNALSDAAVNFDKANAKRASGDWPAAIAAYSQALASDPNHAEALVFRGWSRLCAGAPGAESDARQALDLKGWRDPLAPYIALLGYLSATEAGHEKEARAFLDEALANTRPPAWPSPVFRYLNRMITSSAFLSAATDREKLTEAHAVIGQDLYLRGERTAALEHLRWVVHHGVDGSIAKDFSRETLRRISGDLK